LQIPEPVAAGRPTAEYPYHWSIYRWIDGEPYRDELIGDERRAAADLAAFVTELRRIDPVGAPSGGRKPLARLDVVTRTAIEASRGTIDCDAAADAWQEALEAPVWDGTPVWIHADLLRPNVLVGNGIDFGSAGVGDPAADVIAAWSIFGESGRTVIRDALEVDDGTWNRARGYALTQAALIIPYYAKTNPAFVLQAKRTVEEILADRR
jgi:aminoglycoside phosphotransferase (APT) family kinase protein